MMPVLDGIETLARIKADERAAAHPGDHDLGRGRDRPGRALHRARGGGLPPEAVQQGDPARPRRRLPRAQAAARRERAHLAEIEAQRQPARRCLRAILPAPAVAELQTTGRIAPRRFEDVAVLLADVVGFTAYCDRHRPEEVVAELDRFARACERPGRGARAREDQRRRRRRACHRQPAAPALRAGAGRSPLRPRHDRGGGSAARPAGRCASASSSVRSSPAWSGERSSASTSGATRSTSPAGSRSSATEPAVYLSERGRRSGRRVVLGHARRSAHVAREGQGCEPAGRSAASARQRA